MLRIIAGSYRGRKLLQPETHLTRPTTDKVKEALFSILNSLFLKYDQTWSQQTAIDFFAGSGSLIFECLSRGAAYGLAIDHSALAIKTINANKAQLKLSTTIMDACSMDVMQLRPASQAFSIIFLDPPYSFQHLPQLIDDIINLGWCASEAWFVFELSINAPTPQHDQIHICLERTYGNIKIVIGRLKSLDHIS